ncbi:MAG: DUF1566 domain-containing protein [Methylococcaceae bacterium]
MLDNHPRHQLRFIIENYGRSIIDDPRRCRGMLKDLAPKHQRETNLLMLALDQKLVAELTQKTHTPILMHLDILAQRLHNNVGIQKDFAVWAIESWALALDVIQQPSAQTIITHEPKPIQSAPPIPTIVKPAPKIIVPPKPAPIISETPQKIGKFIVQDGVATDTETGLMWLRFAHGQRWKNGTVEGDTQKLNWDDAMKIPDTFNQKEGYAGYNDWRVPNIEELKTIVLGETVGSWKGMGRLFTGKRGNYIIDEAVFPNNPAAFFWSSSPSANYSNYAWSVSFNGGYSNDYRKSNYDGVRLVR